MDFNVVRAANEVGLCAIMIILLLVCLWGIVRYVFASLSLFKMGKARNVSSYGLAWVPCLWVWTLGGIADKHDSRNGKDHHWRIVLLVLAGATLVLMMLYFALYSTWLFQIFALGAQTAAATDLEMVPQLFDGIWGLMTVAILASLVGMASSACTHVCYFKLYESCKPKTALKNFLVALLVPFAAPFVLFCCRNWIDGERIGCVEETDPTSDIYPDNQ